MMGCFFIFFAEDSPSILGPILLDLRGATARRLGFLDLLQVVPGQAGGGSFI